MNKRQIEGGVLSSFMSFSPVRLDQWNIKLSYVQSHEHFILIAVHIKTYDCVVRSFVTEEELSAFIFFLSERQ